MNFLAPLFLAGAAVVILPVLFHLIRRSVRRRREFSSLMFLKLSPPRLVRRNRIEHWLLLLLRCAAIALLALAFARPFLQRPVALPPGTGARQLVLLVDRSASMRRERLWDDALGHLRRWAQQAGPNDQIAVYAFDRALKPIVTFNQWTELAAGGRVQTVLERAGQIGPGWDISDTGRALIRAIEIMDEDRGADHAPRERKIVLISDLQEGSKTEALNRYDWPDDVQVLLEPVRARNVNNAGIQPLFDLEEDARGKGPALVRCRIINDRQSARAQFQLRWQAPGTAPALGVNVPPAQARVFNAPPRSQTNSIGELLLAGDDSDFDNHAFFATPAIHPLRVALAGAEPPNDPAGLGFYLRRAFGEGGGQPAGIVPPAGVAYSEAELREVDCIFLTGGAGAADLAAARAAVEGGKTAVVVVKDSAAAGALNQLLGRETAAVTEANISSQYAMLAEIQFQHPIFAIFADPRFSDFTKIHFWKHRRLSLRDENVRVLARFDDGDPALVEIPLAAGRILVLTAGWHPADSDLALSSKFVPLVHSIVEYTRPPRQTRLMFHVGEAIDIAGLLNTNTNTNAIATAGSLRVRNPQGTEQPVPALNPLFTPETPGIYWALHHERTLPFAVNLDPAESRTAMQGNDFFERLNVPLEAGTASSEVKSAGLIQRRLQNEELEGRQKLWRNLVLAAIGVLLVETWLGGWLTRRALGNAPA